MTNTLEAEAPALHAQERLSLPGALEPSKLPLLTEPTGGAILTQELRAAWTEYMVNGFRQNERMFQHTLAAFMKPYRLTVWLYASLFVMGIALFVIAAAIGLTKGNSVVAIAFAGLSVTTFLAFFIRQPLQALEENLELITWLGVAFNTYWTRLMYMSDSKAIQAELKAAEDDFCGSVERLMTRHAELRGKRAGS